LRFLADERRLSVNTLSAYRNDLRQFETHLAATDGRQGDAALDAARELVTQYLGQQPHIMKASGVPQSLLDEIGQVLTWPATAEQGREASKLVPDDIVQMICAAGTPDAH
jgi:hypothetical protein